MKEPIPAHRQVGEHRYRESIGLVYEEFEVGDVFEHRPGRTITETDCVLGSLIFMNPHPIHIDAAYAERSEFKQLLVNSSITLGIVSGMTVRSTSGKGIANLGWDKIRLRTPVFVGDTIYAESRIASKRESRSRPGEGIVVIEVTATNQRDEVIMTYERAFLVPKRGSEIAY
jgi:itaconyl-CoA hydratase